MASPHEVRVSISDRHAMNGDATLGSALERVLEAQQDLVVQRASLMMEEWIAKASELASRSLLAGIGAVFAFAGWFIAMFGLIDALDAWFARFAVELAVGVLHIAAGAGLIYARRNRARASA